MKNREVKEKVKTAFESVTPDNIDKIREKTDAAQQVAVAVPSSGRRKKGFFKMGRKLSKSYSEIRKAYSLACKMDEMIRNKKISKNYNRMSSSGFKVLVVGHSYTIHDDYFMKPIADQIEKNSGVLIYSDEFDESVTRKASKKYSRELYWKYQKEAIGSIALLENQIDGVVFISTFPCGPDSLVNELVMRKIHLPHLNLVIDDMDATAGIETRIESFMDMLYER